MKTSVRSTALAAAAILVLLGGSSAAFANTSQHLSLTVPYPQGGGVVDFGSQNYVVSGGYAFGAALNLAPINSPSIQYSFVATENDGSVSGYGSIRLTGTITGEGRVTVSGTYAIDDNIPAVTVPGDPNIVPGYFVSDAPNVMITVDGSTQPLGMPLAIETPYANPWGGPIVIYSIDCLLTGGTSCTLSAIASYNVGTIYWQGSQVAGPVTGTLGSTAVSGMIVDTGNEVENLVTGTAVDQGTTSLTISGASVSLSVNGNYAGNDIIPTNGTIDCSTGFTNVYGTCFNTGFISHGHFSAPGVVGTYSTFWTVPAFQFGSTIQATVTQSGPSSGSGGLSGIFGFLSRFPFGF